MLQMRILTIIALLASICAFGGCTEEVEVDGKRLPLKTFTSETMIWRNDRVLDGHFHYIDDACKAPAGSTYFERPFDDYPAERYWGSGNWEEDGWKRIQIVGAPCDDTVGFIKMNAAEITSAKARADKARAEKLRQEQITAEPHKCATGAGSALACDEQQQRPATPPLDPTQVNPAWHRQF
jgi:hypothetical protein